MTAGRARRAKTHHGWCSVRRVLDSQLVKAPQTWGRGYGAARQVPGRKRYFDLLFAAGLHDEILLSLGAAVLAP